MGFYIQTESPHGKAGQILRKFGGEELPCAPVEYHEIPEGKALIVVVLNAHFEAAGHVVTEQDFEDFTDPGDARPRRYLLIDSDVASEESGYADWLERSRA